MHLLLTVVSCVLLCTLSAVAQETETPEQNTYWWFPDRVTLSNGEGNTSPSRPVSFVNDTLYEFDVSGPFSITAWLRVSSTGTNFWRAAVSIESPDATSALFRVALPPDQMRFNVAWMRSAQARGGAINTTAVAPGPGVDFHFALVKDKDNAITIYVDGVKRAFHTLSTQIFNPGSKQIVLGRTKLDGNSARSQWNGMIRDVTVSEWALTHEDVLRERDN
ncbi:hypothetical protein CVT26_016007 [Gymnopilus dilepis]|uniref:LamG-like jellyroll fold domain-containing protein n=1 Tax=Gymnopilus dilepis TaxID=231916 RepID=A0A409YDM3_9AGAR|nr:hypothetical protein CVT26_016007 [Gymnopilus dilepis]